MEKTIQQLLSHRTYRHFDEKYQLNEEELQLILDAARQAPSWMNGQMYSIIVIRDPKIRKQLVEWNPGNPQMEKSSVFLLFLVDLHRTAKVAEHYHSDYKINQGLDSLITAVTDTALALENAVVAVEALGLGSSVVGSIRKNIKEIGEILRLPEGVFPLAGLAIGKPVVEMKVKPRLPEKTVVHFDTYQEYDYQEIEGYDHTMKEFAEARETKLWSVKFADYFKEAPNPAVDNYLKEQGFID